MTAPPHQPHFERLVALLRDHPDFATQTGRLRLLTAAFRGVAGAESILTRRPDLDGSPQGAAVVLVEFLATFGQLGGRHALSLLLEQVRATLGDDQQDQIAALIRDLDAGCDRPPDAACPYRSLDAFREEDAPLFFGRGAFTELLVEAVNRHPLVAVIGASGSGKSSVVQAGLIPRLRAQGGWEVGIMRPGADPWRRLAACLSGLLGDEPAAELDRLRAIGELAADLARDDTDPAGPRPTLRLPDLVQRLIEKRAGRRRLLLVVDQWEELYTSGSEAAAPLAERLIAAATAAPLSVVLTLRADFLGHALAHRPLVDRLQDGKVFLGPMTRDELENGSGPSSDHWIKTNCSPS